MGNTKLRRSKDDVDYKVKRARSCDLPSTGSSSSAAADPVASGKPVAAPSIASEVINLDAADLELNGPNQVPDDKDDDDDDKCTTLLVPGFGDPPTRHMTVKRRRWSTKYTMKELERMVEPGFFEGDRLHDPECECFSCQLVWE
jgi:hypothetical protein